MKKKVLFLILDGISDEQSVEKTALEVAYKSNLDMIAKNSLCGCIENRLGGHPDSGISNFVLLGYPKEEYPGRGYLEALGAGLEPVPGSVYVRGNFITVKEVVDDPMKTGTFKPRLMIVDRRAGRDTSGLFEMSKDIKEFFLDGVRVDFYKSLGHRGVLVMNSVNISPEVSDSDPGYVEKPFVQEIRAKKPSPEATKTAAALNKFQEQTYKILKDHPGNKYRETPANFILLRGASSYKYIKSFKYSFGFDAACVAASPVIKGIGKAIEMEIPDVSGATGDLKTNLRDKTMAALDMLNKHDFVVLHILGFDVAAHDKDNNKKRFFIEKVDREVFRRILEYCNFEKTVLVVASDHPTSTKTGGHLAGFMPFLIFTKDVEANGIENFNEKSCKVGPVIQIEDFMEEVIRYIQ
jgi:2,3-bisphosphoglycerate-independent phosphoglycerate mutase